MKTFADKVIEFNQQLEFKGELPEGIRIMNPFKENKAVISVSSAFYKKYYDDCQTRHLILGINPGRFGSGVTGVPFTDPKRLLEKCDIPFPGPLTHEPSSVFVYDVIDAFGGVEAFYKQFYIHSMCPLGFTNTTQRGREVNYNYYDSKELTLSVYDFMVESLQKQIDFGINTDVCFCFGTGKNEAFLRQLNQDHHFFKKIVALEHPRFVMQYKAKSKLEYIDKYFLLFGQVK